MNIPIEVYYGAITLLGYFLTLLLIRWVLLTRKRNSTSAVAWILAILILPFLGGLLFLVFGINRVNRRAEGKRRATIDISRQLPTVSEFQHLTGDGLEPRQYDLMELAQSVGATSGTFANHVQLLPETSETLELIEEAILSAEKTLHLEYYIWKADRTGTHLRDLLIQRANEGVKVRFLYDGLGSIWLNRRFFEPMRQAGIDIAAFLPGQTLRERWSINLRSHRKIVIADGQVGFTGGMNIGDEYLGLNPHLGYWRDTHLKLRGPIVMQLQQVFAEDWYYATGEELTQPELFPRPTDRGNVSAQVIASGPTGDTNEMLSVMFAAINEAEESINLSTSYFVPMDPLVLALETAAHRGVHVRLMVPGKSAYQWTVLAGRSFYNTLLNAGVEIYEYQRGLLHAKTLTVDSSWALVGTPNFDARSLVLNFEVAVAMYDSKLAMQLNAHIEHDITHSQKIELGEWNARATRHVLAENFCKLFAPLM